MKNKYSIILVWLLFLSGCADFTDIQPKGKNILNQVSDFEQLLNGRFGGVPAAAMILVNDFYPYVTNIPNLITNPIKNLDAVLFTWDETVDRAVLTETDEIYETWYKYIGAVANPVIANVEKAAGDRTTARRLKAEAYVLRAWYHYLIVNYYAKAYDPLTAATDPGVPYVTEDAIEDMAVPNRKHTVQEVYDFILSDLEAALALNSLTEQPMNLMRVGKAFAYAAQAQVYLSMRKYGEAYEAAERALGVKNTIDDHTALPAETFSRPRLESTEDIFYTYSLISGYAFTPEMTAAFEEGSILNRYYSAMPFEYLYGMPTAKVWYGLDTYFNTGGLTTVDMYLIQAECKIREGGSENIRRALEILDIIREKRILPEEYSPLSALPVTDASEAIQWLKRVSRTENFFTIKNFIHLKRWNTEDTWKETLSKTVVYTDGQTGEQVTKTYSLKPDSPLWIFPFPQNATTYNPHLEQNY